MQNSSLSNKVAYITGGSKGIGLGTAKVLLELGMRVAISSRSLASAQKAAEQLSADSTRILAIQSDVVNETDEFAAVESLVNKFGQLDVLVANAGVGHFAAIDELSSAQWKETIDTNLTGVFNSVKASIEALKKSEGYIITIASLAGTNF